MSSLVAMMKAVCLLLCLVLAYETVDGNIFGRQSYPRMDLIVQPLDYIDQAQAFYQQRKQHQQTQTSESSEQVRSKHPYQQTSDSESNERVRKYQQQQSQSNEQVRSKYLKHQPSSSESNEQVRAKYQKQYNYEQKQQKQYNTKQRNQKLRTEKQGSRQEQPMYYHDSTSAESNSQETQRRINQYAMPVYADPNTLYRGLSEMKPAYGDPISWKGVQIATSPRNVVSKVDIGKIFSEAYKTMNHVSEENKKIFHSAFEQAARNPSEDAELNATQLLKKYQYLVETHTIRTDDGYNLTLFRIPPKDETLQQRPVVFLMHGLLGSADDWLLMGPSKSLAYLLADAGYDVWLGNARGSKYSRRHVSKHPAQADFWQFSTDEIALHDLPAMIDYVLKSCNQEKLHYVGHAQGTTAFFALASTRPEYNNKIIMMYALSPMAYMSNVRSPLLRMIAPTSQFYERLHQQLGHGEFKPTQELVYTVGGAMCETEIGCRNVCSNAYFVMSGVNVDNMDVNQIPVIMGHLPAGASTRQIKQYAQAVASREFTKYDFGAEINEQVYGSRQPPKYDMSMVQTPVTLYYSEEDWLAHPKDVERLEKELPNVKESYKVPEPHFSHMDFQFSKIAPQVVYNRLIESIKQQSTQNYVY